MKEQERTGITGTLESEGEKILVSIIKFKQYSMYLMICTIWWM